MAEWPIFEKMAAHSAYNILLIKLFPTSVFGVGISFLIVAYFYVCIKNVLFCFK